MGRLPPSLTSLLVTHYGLEPIGQPQTVTRGTQGTKFVVPTDAGHVLVRRVPTAVFCDRAFACDWQVAVNGAHLAPAVYRTTSNQLFVEDGGTTTIVEQYVLGAPRALVASDGHAIGRALGRMHRAGLHVAGASRQAEAWQTVAGATWAGIRERDTTPREEAVIAELCDRARAACARLQTLPAGIPCGVHGDVNPSNLLWQDSRLVFCDFVNACPLPQVIDLAMAIIGCGVLHWDLVAGTEFVPDNLPQRMTPFMLQLATEYAATRPLLPTEITLLPDALWFVVARWLPWLRFTSSQHAIQYLVCMRALGAQCGASCAGPSPGIAKPTPAR